MRIRIFKQGWLHMASPLLHPSVCSHMGVLSASIRFGVFIKSIHTNCLSILLHALGRKLGAEENLALSPTSGGFSFHMLDLCWWPR